MSIVEQQDGSGGLIADLAAKFDFHIGSLSKAAKAMAAATRRPPAQPVFGRIATTGTAPASGILVLRFPLAGPDQGHFWYVRQLVVGGLTRTTAAAGSVDVFVSATSTLSALGSLAAIGIADERDFSAAMPNNAFYGRGELALRFNEELFVVVSGGTSGQAYVAAASFEDFEEAGVREEWSV